MIIIRNKKASFFSSNVLADLMSYKFLFTLISFLMIISCSENDVSTTELAPTSTPLIASTPIPTSTPLPVSTSLPDIKQVPTVEPIVEVKEETIVEVKEEPIVEVKEEPIDDDFQEGITFNDAKPKDQVHHCIVNHCTEAMKPEFVFKDGKWQLMDKEDLVEEIFESLDNPRRTSQYLGWGKFYDVESLRLFAAEDVSDRFMLSVATTYTLMFSTKRRGFNMHVSRSPIDIDLQNTFFKTIRDERVFQKILYLGKDNDYDETSNALTSRYPGGGYLHNYSGHLVDHGHQDSHRREIIGQSLRTIIFTLRLMSDDFDHKDPNSALSKAYQEAVDKNLFAFTPDRPEPAELFYDEAIIKFLTNVITTEWGNRHLYKIYADEKFTIKDKNELINKLPLSHKLYEEFIEKILNPIDHVLFEKINEYNFESKVY